MEPIKDEKETGRLEGFSDGVIAVAITLLVLALQPPTKTSNADLLTYLWNQGPYFLAFVTSFVTVGVMWINHHRMFSYIRRTDSTLMSLNLLLLLFIVFIPYPTALVAQYLTFSASPNERVAALLFNGSYFLLAICFNLLFRYAARENRLMGKEIDQKQVQVMLGQFNIGPLAYLITFAFTWVNVPLSLTLNLLLAVFWALPINKRPSFMSRSISSKARRTGTTGLTEN